jgi:signal transduction histidine kinase
MQLPTTAIPISTSITTAIAIPSILPAWELALAVAAVACALVAGVVLVLWGWSARTARHLRSELARTTAELLQSNRELERSHAELASSHSRLEESHMNLEQSHVNLKIRSLDLGSANQELEAINRELRATQVKLVQSEKMAALGQLVAGVAHELNNPLGVIQANHDVVNRVCGRLKELAAEISDKAPEAAPRLARYLDFIRELQGASNAAAVRIQRLAQSLRQFSRLDEAERKPADLHAGIESALTLLEHRLRDRVEVVRDFAPLPLIFCNPAALNQAFMQLIANAIDATADRQDARLVIRTRANADRVLVTVEDNGHGIAPADLSRIFDPGYTTRGVGVGMGLGLPIVYQVVTEHGGEVGAESEPGKGAAFTIRLPIAPPPASPGAK